MVKLNPNFAKLQANYLFSTVRERTNAYAAAHPDAKIIRLGIGDVTKPLAPAVIEAMHAAVEEMGHAETFKGYGEDFGYSFLRSAIADNDYAPLGIKLDIGEIFISDGAKSDTGNIGELFSEDCTVAVCDPVYPVYVDSNVMAGRAGDYDGERWSRLVYMPCVESNGFVPDLPEKPVDMIYLCFPNNPTGAHATYDDLKRWVDYALKTGAVILYDAAYSCFISEGLPRSIYEIEGARGCAIEFKSFSKTAGFTGVRCAYTVIPQELKVGGVSVNAMWRRRQNTKFNEASYISQRGAAAIYTEAGAAQVAEVIGYYKRNALMLRDGLRSAGFTVYGGENSPYIWMRTPDGMSSWDFFDTLLDRVQVVGTPGSGFGPSGEGFFRLTAFGTLEMSEQALERIRSAF